MQQPFSFALPQTTWQVPRLSDLSSWKDAKRVGIDVECRDPLLEDLGPGCRRDPRTNYVCGFSFAIEDGPAHYVPLRHEGGDNVEGDGIGYLRDQLREFSGTLIGNGINYDDDWLITELVKHGCTEQEAWSLVLRHPHVDVQGADVMINELEYSYGMDAICKRRGLPGKDETKLIEAAKAFGVHDKRDLWKMPARYVAEYGVADAVRPVQIYRRQEPLIAQEGVESIWALERKVTPILTKLRRRGVRIDLQKLSMIERRSLEVVREEMEHVRQLTGVSLGEDDVWKSDALAHALRVAGYAPGKTATGKASVDKVLLAACGTVGKAILRAREWSKLRTTFCKQVREHLVGDRVHCSFHQLRNNSDDNDEGGRGVRYGRFSCTDPNLQQQPGRHDEFAALWRSIYIADDGENFASLDFSQQEPRVAVHYAEALDLPGAREMAEEYRRNPSLDIHQKLADISGMPRKIVKNFVNGRIYAMGNTKMCRQLGQPTVWKVVRGERKEVPGPDGQAMIDQFDRFAPWVQGLVRAATRAAEKHGHVWTILRRKCRFDRGPDGKIWRSHKALNRIGQGSAADAGKATLVAADAEGIPVQLVVHDEYCFSYSDVRVPLRMKELMLSAVVFSVPMKIDFESGLNWGEMKKQ